MDCLSVEFLTFFIIYIFEYRMPDRDALGVATISTVVNHDLNFDMSLCAYHTAQTKRYIATPQNPPSQIRRDLNQARRTIPKNLKKKGGTREHQQPTTLVLPRAHPVLAARRFRIGRPLAIFIP
jgi:hypothetical protein